MKLRRLDINGLPGIREPFALNDVGDGFNVIVGPNGVGKSSLCRAVRSLLWAKGEGDGYIDVSALFDRGDQQWRVERQGSRHRWQRDGIDELAPPLPAPHLDACFFLVLRDLLDASDDAGSELATQIRRLMSGGFDLEDTEASVFGAIGSRHGRKERRALDEAERKLKKAVGEHEQLSRREQQLGELEEKRAAARIAQKRLRYVDEALVLDRDRADRVRVEAELAEFSHTLSKLTGEELTQLDQREGELADKRIKRGEQETNVRRAQRAAQESRLEELLDTADLSTWTERANKLADLEARLEPAVIELQERRQAVVDAGRVIGAAADKPVPTLDLSDAGDLFQFLREVTDADRERSTINQRLSLLKGREPSSDDREQLGRLRPAADALRAWLRAPDPAGGNPALSVGLRSVLFAVGGILGVGGIALAISVNPAYAFLAGVGLGLVITLVMVLRFVRPDPTVGYPREAAQHEFPTGLSPPDAWRVDKVSECLREIEGRIAELEAAEQRARDRGVERATLESELEESAGVRADLERKRQVLAARLGLERIHEDAELVSMARALDHLARAQQTAAAADAGVKEHGAQRGQLLEDLAAVLTTKGEAEPTDAASARAGIEQLSTRSSALRTATAAELTARDAIKVLDGDCSAIDEIMAAIYQRAEIEAGDRAAITHRLADLGPYREAVAKRDALDRTIQGLVESLSNAGEQDLSEITGEVLEEEKDRLQAKADQLNALSEELANIQAEVKQAREGHSLEETIGQRETAVRSLETCRDEALLAATGRFLLDTVKREHETHQMPEVLKRAQELFATFTQHAYELRVSRDGDGSFIAIETRTGETRRLPELSDGARAQLLLAARLAFAEEADREAPLPLFLDEALDQSDPVRFQAIVKSLGMMIENEGRQVFYLTSDPIDVDRIQASLQDAKCAPPHIIDLGQIRKVTQGVSALDSLRIEPLPQTPAPNGATPEEYAMRLHVPPLRPQRGFADQHLIYVLWMDLNLLHRLLVSGIEQVGQWEFLSRKQAPLAKSIVEAGGAGTQLNARVAMLEVFCRSWNEGRGRPIDREVIERGKISERYRDAVAEIAHELNGDGERLIDALRTRSDARLQGFRTKAATDFETLLVEEGYLDTRPVLGEAEIRTQLLATPAASLLPDQVAAELSHRWWRLASGSAGTEP